MTTRTIYDNLGALLGDTTFVRYTGTILRAYIIQAITEAIEKGEFSNDDIRGIITTTHAVAIPLSPTYKPEIDLDTSTIVGAGEKCYKVLNIYNDPLYDGNGTNYITYKRVPHTEWDTRYTFKKPTTNTYYWDVVGKLLKFWSAATITAARYFSIEFITTPTYPASSDTVSLIETYYSVPFMLRCQMRAFDLIKVSYQGE